MELQHPAVVRVLDPRGEDASFCYFVMELVPGGNLREAVLAQRVKPPDVLPLILQVGEALAVANEMGTVHRDIKPANILLDERGNAKLTDFDLVGALDTTGGTRTGALGTVVYAAPECLDKPQEATARADVYGLGMTAIFGLVGREISLSTFRDPEPTIAGLDCSAEVKDVLRRAVAWEPEQRFADAHWLVAAFRVALTAPDTLNADKGEAVVLSEISTPNPGTVSLISPQLDRATDSATVADRSGRRTAYAAGLACAAVAVAGAGLYKGLPSFSVELAAYILIALVGLTLILATLRRISRFQSTKMVSIRHERHTAGVGRNLLRGMVITLDIGATVRTTTRTAPNDFDAIRSDWDRVIQDVRSATAIITSDNK
jgi:serine/threonine protein kinase